MNIQDIADFIDLVNNPQRYEAILKNLQDRQDKLNETIENVAKATELDKLLKQNKKRSDDLEVEFANKVAVLEKQHQDKVSKVKEAQDFADKQVALANSLVSDADDRVKLIAVAEKEAKEKEQKAKAIFADAEEKQKKLDALIADYEDKVAKFKQIMG